MPSRSFKPLKPAASAALTRLSGALTKWAFYGIAYMSCAKSLKTSATIFRLPLKNCSTYNVN